MRRNKAALEAIIANAKSKSAKAIACYKLALFHDNNSREKEAIPYYRQAIKLGLPRAMEAEAHAWLASSLYKTNHSTEALRELRTSLKLTRDSKLKTFLTGLLKRILRSAERAK